MSHFNQNASIEHNGTQYHFDPEDLTETSTERFHGPGDPSTWLCARLVTRARVRWRALPRAKAMQLCADTLGIDVKKLESSLEWNAQYMAWHDGGNPQEEHPWPPESG